MHVANSFLLGSIIRTQVLEGSKAPGRVRSFLQRNNYTSVNPPEQAGRIRSTAMSNVHRRTYGASRPYAL